MLPEAEILDLRSSSNLEILLQRLPAFVILCVQLLARFLAPLGHGHTQRRFEHEGLRSVSDTFRLEFRIGGSLEALPVRTVRSHHGMEGCASRQEAALLGFVATEDQTHKFAHAVAWNVSELRCRKLTNIDNSTSIYLRW